MRTVAFYVNEHRPRAMEFARSAVQLAAERGFGVAFPDDQGRLFEPHSAARLELADLIVTFGGDGTLLRGMRLAVPLDVPVFGVNTGRMGFLTEIDEHDDVLCELANVFEGRFHVEERVALEAAINGRGALVALNDVVVRRASNARMAPFGLSLDNEPVAWLPSDGIIVATPTGSTAYFLSAGGPIISPGVDAFGIAALLPHTLFARPLIVPTSSAITLIVDSEAVRVNLDIDGVLAANLSAGDRVTVRRAPRPVKFARTRQDGFFTRLEEKLQWGVPIKHES